MLNNAVGASGRDDLNGPSTPAPDQAAQAMVQQVEAMIQLAVQLSVQGRQCFAGAQPGA